MTDATSISSGSDRGSPTATTSVKNGWIGTSLGEPSARAFLEAYESPAFILERNPASASSQSSSPHLTPLWTNIRWDLLSQGRSLVDMLDTDGLRQFGSWIKGKEREDERARRPIKGKGTSRNRTRAMGQQHVGPDVDMEDGSVPRSTSAATADGMMVDDDVSSTTSTARSTHSAAPSNRRIPNSQSTSIHQQLPTTINRNQPSLLQSIEALFGTTTLTLNLAHLGITVEFSQTPYWPPSALTKMASFASDPSTNLAHNAALFSSVELTDSPSQHIASTSHVIIQTLLRPNDPINHVVTHRSGSPMGLTMLQHRDPSGLSVSSTGGSPAGSSTDIALSTALSQFKTRTTPLASYELPGLESSPSATTGAAGIFPAMTTSSNSTMHSSSVTLTASNNAPRDYFSGSHGQPSPSQHRLVSVAEDPRDPLSIDYLLDHTDWKNTPLGPREQWPQSLKVALSMILGSRQQATLWWGKDDKVMLYNTEYSKNISAKHPWIFGKRGAEAWAEVWESLGKIGDIVTSGTTMWEENEMFLFRTGNGDELEEQYHSWQWSPIWSEPFVEKSLPGTRPEVLGLFNTTKNTTSEVLAERRGRVLHDLRDLLGKAREADDFDRAVVEGLASEPKDLPFMMWYHVQLEENSSSTKSSKTASEDERNMTSSLTPTTVILRLGGSVGAVDPERQFSMVFNKAGKAYNLMPETPGDEDYDEDMPPLRVWPFREALATRQKLVVDDCRPFIKGWTPRSWDVLPNKAVVIPICVESDDAVPYGVLIIGLNPRCPFNEDYQGFVHSVSLQIYAGIIQMRADQIQRLEERAEEAEHRRSIAEEERRQQELLIDVTSHEIRNPLSAMINCAQIVKGNLSVLRNDFVNAITLGYTYQPTSELVSQIDEDCDALESIHACSITLESISNDILALGRIQLDMLTFNLVDTNMEQVAAKLMSIYSHESRMNDITLSLDLDPSIARFNHIKTDPTRLHQIIGNLVSNSLKFSAGRPIRKVNLAISLSFEPPSSDSTCLPPMTARLPDTAYEGQQCYVYVAVTDSGPGLKEEDLLLLFRRFSQASNQPTKVFGGSGLGLFVCRKIAEQMGGRIEVDSEFGQGSTFRFFITASIANSPARPTTTEMANALNAIPSRKRRKPFVLIVEDNPINQKVLARQIKGSKMTCEVANNGLEALQRIRQLSSVDMPSPDQKPPFDVVLMDLEMPVMGGLACIRQIREEELTGRLHRSTVWALTGNARQAQIEEAISQGMDMVWIKPYKIEDLIDKIESHVDAVALR